MNEERNDQPIPSADTLAELERTREEGGEG
jgi:hypothetical protein